ncbi:MAG: HipA N-terminal domain-containing protein [Sulfuricaulis sp.]
MVTAQVRLWGQLVGAVAEQDDGTVVFEYDPAFRRSGLQISPIKLPLSLAGPVSFPELSRVGAFAGLPGVLADSLPDRFGNAIIRKYFSDQGHPERAQYFFEERYACLR